MFEKICFFTKDLGIIICGLIYFYKLFYIKSSLKIIEKSILLGYSLLGGVLAAILDTFIPQVTMLFILLLIIIYVYIFVRQPIKYKYYKSIISFALSYVSFIVSALLTGIILVFFSEKVYTIFNQFVCLITQLIVLLVVVNVKRIQGGLLFINNPIYAWPCILISIFTILNSVIVNYKLYSLSFVVFFIILFVLAILTVIYWHISITRHYLERLSLRNIDSLNDELDEKNEYIKRLLEDKERLEKLNHKNYKLIPALQGAVMHYLEGVSTFIEINADNPALAELAAAQEINMKEFITEGNRLMNDIKELQSEWKEMVDSDDIEGIKEVPKCGVTRVDYLLSYTYERSKKENFSFRADVDSDLSGITEKIISEADLATLIADLIENAIIATKYNDGKDILVRMGIMKKEYVIEIYDSGVKFDKDVLLKYGVEKITTHADDNGSGIGMMQTYEILNNCGASIYIDELSDKSGLFTKRISIVFNKKNQYVLYTKRDDDEVAYLHKRSDLLIIKK